MAGRHLTGDWPVIKEKVLAFWPHLTAADIADLAGEREALMRVLKARYDKSYAEIEREVAEFELHELRAGYVSRPSRGIGPD